jgi:hypothetical protein
MRGSSQHVLNVSRSGDIAEEASPAAKQGASQDGQGGILIAGRLQSPAQRSPPLNLDPTHFPSAGVLKEFRLGTADGVF